MQNPKGVEGRRSFLQKIALVTSGVAAWMALPVQRVFGQTPLKVQSATTKPLQVAPVKTYQQTFTAIKNTGKMVRADASWRPALSKLNRIDRIAAVITMEISQRNQRCTATGGPSGQIAAFLNDISTAQAFQRPVAYSWGGGCGGGCKDAKGLACGVSCNVIIASELAIDVAGVALAQQDLQQPIMMSDLAAAMRNAANAYNSIYR